MKKFYASMMCANFGNLKEEIIELEQAGVDGFHLDVMDGQFVPNFGLGLQDIEYICENANVICDVHLMCEKPGQYIRKFAELGANIIYVHYESDQNIVRTLQDIKNNDVSPGIAINPGTSVYSIEPILNIVDYVLVMTVNPGFSGQNYIDFVEEKIRQLVLLKNKYHFEIVIDGACSRQVITKLGKIGADSFVLGTSSLFKQNKKYSEIMKSLKEGDI
ncbi:MAG: ribulose-phosphate 3-epimerase [Erysipelotrichaceae bacterium]|nr:ribulose-phosphate 3-epimerase [Erysipelotrichaceae bacterium]